MDARQVPDDFVARVFATMAATPQHTYQVLTKRPGRMASLLGDEAFRAEVAGHLFALAVGNDGHVDDALLERASNPWEDWPLPNVWLGTSVESQQWADVRVPLLLKAPAAVHFLSMEPLIEKTDLDPEQLGNPWARANAHSRQHPRHILGPVEDDDGRWRGHMECVDDGLSDDPYEGRGCGFDTTKSSGIDWVIIGGESGPGARPLKLQWVRSLVTRCQDAGVAVLVKQLGQRPEMGGGTALRLDDPKGGDPAE